MHLDRPLDSFLDMVHPNRLQFIGGKARGCSGSSPDWTPDALRFLGLAGRRVLDSNPLPLSRTSCALGFLEVDGMHLVAQVRQQLSVVGL